MVIIKLLFLILAVVCAAFYVLYVWEFSFVLMIVMLLFPAAMYIITFITKKLISADIKALTHTAAKNETFDVQLCINNRSIFPVGKAEALIEYYNVFNNQINCIMFHFPIQARNSHRLTFQISSKFCGIIKLRSASITIYDPIRIFKFRIGKNIREDITILPEGHDIGGILSSTDRLNDESQHFSEHKPGDDPSEVFDLRDYIPGDKLNRIHWKLSCKKDDFIVKDYSLPIDSPTMLFLDLVCPEDSEYTLPMYDTLLESFMSVSQFLLENQRIHSIVYYNAARQCFDECLIDTQDALISAVTEIISSISDDLGAEYPEVYFSDFSNSGLASFTFFTANNNDQLLSYIDDEIDADMKNIIQIVKTANEAQQKVPAYSSLSIIPVVIGRISSSVKDIEL